jgi:hypothetical protein
MSKQILVQEKVEIWREFHLNVPNGMSKKEFVKHLKKTDPAANQYENEGLEYLNDTETSLEVEYYDKNYTILGKYVFDREIKTMKYLYIELEVINGVFTHNHRVLYATMDDVNLATKEYAKNFYDEENLDDNKEDNDVYFFFNGCISVKVIKVEELTEEKYFELHSLFYE